MNLPSPEALFIVDGSYLLYRSYYAIRPLHTSQGTPTQAIFGFCRAIKKLLDSFKPKHLVVVWDSKVKTFRHEQYPAYKANRQKPPSDLFEQKEKIISFLELIKIKQLSCDGYEADDVIGALAQKYLGQPITLVCPDKDMYQLLSESLTIFDPFKEQLITQESFEKDWGFANTKIPFYYALLGDSSDNIPGVKGIGEKTAAKIVTEFNSLDDLYQNIDKIKQERTRSLLSNDKENAYLSFDLFLLKPPAIDTSMSDFMVEYDAWRFAREMFVELEFGSLVKDIDKRFAQHSAPRQQNLFTQSDEPEEQAPVSEPAPALAVKKFNMTIIQDEAALSSLLQKLDSSSEIAIDTETTGGMAMQDSLVGMSFAVDEDHAYYLPLAHDNEKQLSKSFVFEKLKPILENRDKQIIMHNAKFDVIILEKAGINIPHITFDTLLAANLLRKEWEKINLKQLSLSYLNEPMQKFKDVLGKEYKSFNQVPIEHGASYAAHDALQTLKLKHLFEKALSKESELLSIFVTVEMPFSKVLTAMEMKGILLDRNKIDKTSQVVSQDIKQIEDKIQSFVASVEKEAINLNAPRQIEKLLFDWLKLPVVKKSSKGQRSTDQDTLQELSLQHPIPGLVLKYRELSKLKNTYLEPLPTFINPETHRVHTSFSQTLVATGRLSSSDPNLQNIPTKEGYGMQIRDAFFAPEGSVFLSADYSQIELRILAFLSQDPTLIDIFKHNRDIHAETASQLFGVSPEAITNQQRQLGKRINFSIIYGMTPYGLSKDLGISMSDAKIYIDRYFERYPGVLNWMEKIVSDSIAHGYTKTWLGRRRYVKELQEKNRSLFEQGKRIAINTPVQGTAAELMKLAMIQLNQKLFAENLQSAISLQIHDEIIIETPLAELKIIEALVKDSMEKIIDWNVPLSVSLRSGKTWADVSK